MRFHALAVDYDGTLASHGTVSEATLASLRSLKASGRKLILVTGRVMEDLKTVFPEWEIFDCLVVENGAVVYRPGSHIRKILGDPPPEAFVEALLAKGVGPIGRGKVIVATWEPHEDAVLETIREFALEHHVIFNKGAVMILPSGINKATGLSEALRELGLSPHNTVAVGDAENDNAMLELCECAVAVANALPRLKEKADYTTIGAHGEGVAQLAGRLIDTDLLELAPRLSRYWFTVGHRTDGTPVRVDPYTNGVLLVGSSGGGKTTFASAFLESLGDAGYQFLVFDPEGDYEGLDDAVELGSAKHPPVPAEVVRTLDKPGRNVVACALGIPFADRPEFFQETAPDLYALRSRTGRPHWIMVDEAHHLLPATRAASISGLARDMHGLFLVTVEPEHVNPVVLEQVDWVFVVGVSAPKILAGLSLAMGFSLAGMFLPETGPGEALVWRRGTLDPPFKMRCLAPRREQRRHLRKYSDGDLGPDKQFHFRGPEGKLSLRVQNLMIFVQIAEGVDSETWLHHLRQGDYSHWFRQSIKDDSLADTVAEVERESGQSADESRRIILGLVQERYTGAI